MTGGGGIDIKPGSIARVNCKGHVLHRKYVIVDGVIAAMKLKSPQGEVFMMPPLITLRGAEGAFAGESFAFPPQWLREVPVPPAWAAKLRRQAYGLDRPLQAGNAL